jgi:hypothetical protein
MNDITRWKKSGYKCPACDRLLWVLPLVEGVVYFCGWGPCPSTTANDGAPSYEELVRKWGEEPEYKESVGRE